MRTSLTAFPTVSPQVRLRSALTCNVLMMAPVGSPGDGEHYARTTRNNDADRRFDYLADGHFEDGRVMTLGWPADTSSIIGRIVGLDFTTLAGSARKVTYFQ